MRFVERRYDFSWTSSRLDLGRKRTFPRGRHPVRYGQMEIQFGPARGALGEYWRIRSGDMGGCSPPHATLAPGGSAAPANTSWSVPMRRAQAFVRGLPGLAPR